LTLRKFAGSVSTTSADKSRDTGLVRLFQNARYYPSLRPRIRELTRDHSTFAGKIDAFLNFREGAAHILLPVDQRAEWAFFTTRRFFATALLLAGMGGL
jgi:hypothetical protein